MPSSTITNSSPPKRDKRVARSYGTAQSLGHLAEELVADLVPEVVVDDLEPIEVAEEEGHPVVRAVRLQQGMVEMVQQQSAVGQAGQRVLEGTPGQLFLEHPALRSVVEDDHGGRGLRLVNRRRGHGDVHASAVAPVESNVVGDDALPQRDGPHGRVEEEQRRLGSRNRDHGRVGLLALGPAQHPGPGPVHESDLPVLVDRAHALAQAAHDQGEVVVLLRGFGVEIGVGQGYGGDRRQRTEQEAVSVPVGLASAPA